MPTWQIILEGALETGMAMTVSPVNLSNENDRFSVVCLQQIAAMVVFSQKKSILAIYAIKEEST